MVMIVKIVKAMLVSMVMLVVMTSKVVSQSS